MRNFKRGRRDLSPMAGSAPFCAAASRKASRGRRCLPRRGRKSGLDPFGPHFSQTLAGIPLDCQLVASDGSNRGLRKVQPPSPSGSPGRIISKPGDLESGSDFKVRQSRAPRVVPPSRARGSAQPNPDLDRLRAGLFLSGTADQIFAAPRMRPGEPSGPTTCRRMAHLRPGWAERTDAGSFRSTLLPFHMPTVSMSRTLWR